MQADARVEGKLVASKPTVRAHTATDSATAELTDSNCVTTSASSTAEAVSAAASVGSAASSDAATATSAERALELDASVAGAVRKQATAALSTHSDAASSVDGSAAAELVALPATVGALVKPSPAAAVSAAAPASAAPTAADLSSPSRALVSPSAGTGAHYEADMDVDRRTVNPYYPLVQDWWQRRLEGSKRTYITALGDLVTVLQVKPAGSSVEAQIFNWNTYKHDHRRIGMSFDRALLRQLASVLGITSGDDATHTTLTEAIMLVVEDEVCDPVVGGALCGDAQRNTFWDEAVRTHAAKYERLVVNVKDLAFDFVDPIAAAAPAAAAAASGGDGTAPSPAARVASPYTAAARDHWARVTHFNIKDIRMVRNAFSVDGVAVFEWNRSDPTGRIGIDFGATRFGLRALAVKLGAPQDPATLDALSIGVLQALGNLIKKHKLGPSWCVDISNTTNGFWTHATRRLAATHSSLTVTVSESTLDFTQPKAPAGAAAKPAGKVAVTPSPSAAKR